jgi:hypothetical protein
MVGTGKSWTATIVATLGLVGCANLPDVPLNQCGNGIVEQPNDEDCDGPGIGPDGGVSDAGTPCSAQCRAVCDGDAGTCPWGWGCGTDHICRRPGGAFTSTGIQINENVSQLRLADLDGSGRKAILVDTGAQLDVHYVDDRGAVSHTTSFTALQPKPAVGDFDGDGIDDVAYRLETAIAVRHGATDQSLTALPFPVPLPVPTTTDPNAPDLQLKAGERLIAVDAKGIDVKNFKLKELLRLDGSQVTTFVPLLGTMNVGPPIVLASIGSSSLPSPEAAVPVGKWDESSPCEQFVLANKDLDRLEVYHACRSLGSNIQWNDVALPGALPMVPVTLAGGLKLRGPAFNIDVDGDHHRDLVVYVAADGAGTGAQLQVAYGDGKGGFGSTPLAQNWVPDFTTSSYMCLSTMNIDKSMKGCELKAPFAIADFNGDHVLDVVNPCGVFLSLFPAPGKPTCAATGTLLASAMSKGGLAGADWTRARVADLNGDGVPDVVATSCADTSITYLENNGSGLFNPYTIPTLGGVDELAVGDFDGDLVQDLVYIERDASSAECDPMAPVAAAKASIGAVFGATSGGPSAPVVLGQLDAIEQIIATPLTSTTDQFTPITNLAVISATPGDAAHRRLELFQGSTDREVLAPYFLVSTDTVLGNTPWLLAMGHFGDPKAPMGIAVLSSERTPGSKAAGRMWFFGQENGALEADAILTLPAVGDPSDYVKPDSGKAAWLATADLGGPPGDEILGIALSGTASRIFVLAQQDGAWPIAMAPEGTDLPAGGYGGPIVVGDVDADGKDDLVLVAPDAGVLVIWNKGTGAVDVGSAKQITLAQLQKATHADGKTPCGDPGKIVAAVVLRTAPALPRQVVIVGEHQSFVATLDPAAPASHAFTLTCDTGLPGVSEDTLVIAGDVDGDGVDDIVLGQPGSVQLFHGVPVIQ